jgi:hypothetical protein
VLAPHLFVRMTLCEQTCTCNSNYWKNASITIGMYVCVFSLENLGKSIYKVCLWVEQKNRRKSMLSRRICYRDKDLFKEVFLPTFLTSIIVFFLILSSDKSIRIRMPGPLWLIPCKKEKRKVTRASKNASIDLDLASIFAKQNKLYLCTWNE